MNFQSTLAFAQQLDEQDPLRSFRQQFIIPSNDGIEKVYFLGNSLGLQPKRTKDKLQKIMERPADEIFDGALKAADMMWRRSLYEGMQLQLYQVPEVIYSKDKIEDAHDQLTILAQMAGVDQIPSGQSTEQQPSRTPEPAPANGQTQQAESTLRPEPAPAAPTEREPGQETELPAAPVQEPEQPRRQELPPAPTENNNPPPPVEELRTDFRASFAGDTEQRSKEIQNNVDPQIQKRIEKQGWRKYFAGIWQRTPWLGGVFRYREERFLDDIMKKTGVHHLEHEMLDLVTRKGKEAYDNLSRWRKYVYVGRNVFSNVFGGMYTAEQKLAQQWVQDQLRGPTADNRGWFKRRWDSIRGVTPPPSQKREGVDPELQK